ncbi:LytTR family DNA-binding domain-containing protein [Kordia sp.]|uniref:LytR/AlgR family response regulator transcription factor n=1 Tax=Kordia sp. TaxID=1965332 RepID=UPI0025BA7C31|nr:LytTR family DNA-binding domain-containing protein [Kordia sp.]MCH2196983.1 LytTR family transcriptional regulator [Kordia sp.]
MILLQKESRQKIRDTENYLLVGTKNHGEYIEKSHILYIEACECYSWIHLRDGSKVLSCKPIGYYEELFSDRNFSRIHRSYLINPYHLKLYEPRYRLVHLRGEIVLPISHRKNRVISKMVKNQESYTPFKVAV